VTFDVDAANNDSSMKYARTGLRASVSNYQPICFALFDEALSFFATNAIRAFFTFAVLCLGFSLLLIEAVVQQDAIIFDLYCFQWRLRFACQPVYRYTRSALWWGRALVDTDHLAFMAS
jgi:hypothetical protein